MAPGREAPRGSVQKKSGNLASAAGNGHPPVQSKPGALRKMAPEGHDGRSRSRNGSPPSKETQKDTWKIRRRSNNREGQNGGHGTEPAHKRDGPQTTRHTTGKDRNQGGPRPGKPTTGKAHDREGPQSGRPTDGEAHDREGRQPGGPTTGRAYNREQRRVQDGAAWPALLAWW